MKFGTLTVVVALLLTAAGLAASPAGAQAADEASESAVAATTTQSAAAIPASEAPVTTAPPVTTTQETTGADRSGAEFNILADCPFIPAFSLCQRTLEINVDARPSTSAEFDFTIRELKNGVVQDTEVHSATDAEPAQVTLGIFRTYRINLTSPAAGYTEIDDVTCTGARQRVTGETAFVDLGDLGDLINNSVECTFVVRNPGSLRINQVTQSPVSNRPLFSYTTTGAGVSPFLLDNDLIGNDANDRSDFRTFTGLTRGRRSFTVAPRAGFRVTAITCTHGASIDLAERRASIFLFDGQDSACTFTETALASVRINLDVKPEDPVDVGFDATTLSPLTTILDDDGVVGARPNTVLFSNVLPSAQTIRQVSDLSGSGFDLRSITCSGPVTATSLATRSVSFQLDPGENIICEFRNDRRGSITIIEDSRPDGPIDYPYTTNNAGVPPSFNLDDDPGDATLPNTLVLANLPAGSVHIITQAIPGGSPPWRLLGITCNTGEQTSLAARSATITIDPGQNVTCTFVNAQFQPDALIGPEFTGAFAGNNIRSATVRADQTLAENVRGGQTTNIFVKVQNDSGLTDDLIVRTVESGQGLIGIAYRTNGVDITTQIRSPAGFTFPAVAEGGERIINVIFTAQANSTAGTGRNADITVASGAAPAAIDIVRARAVRAN